MLASVVQLALAMAVILVGAELFTNAVEWVGRRLGLGEGSVGSVLAAVGTALPETVVPIVAIVFGSRSGQHIGIGAIVGSSFMLTTLAMAVSGLAVVVFTLRGRRGYTVRAEPAIIGRDLRMFIPAYALGVGAAFVRVPWVRAAVAVVLVAAYVVYVIRAVWQEEAMEGELERLILHRAAAEPDNARIAAQAVVALGCIVGGAEWFVRSIEHVSASLGVAPMVLSLLITPFATELPEKFNSVLWIRDGKDTLALGNITGALVFQACLLPAIGIALTPWELQRPAAVAAMVGVTAAAFALGSLSMRRRVHLAALLGAGILYASYVVYVALTI